MVGTGTGHLPERVTIANNTVIVAHPTAWAIRVQGAISVLINGNTLRGPGLPSTYGAGIYLRATMLDNSFRSAIVTNNSISNFGHYGILVAGNVTSAGSASLLSLVISENVFDDDSSTPTMTTGIKLDDGSSIAKKVTLIGNTFIGGIVNQVTNFPSGSGFTCVGITCP